MRGAAEEWFLDPIDECSSLRLVVWSSHEPLCEDKYLTSIVSTEYPANFESVACRFGNRYITLRFPRTLTLYYNSVTYELHVERPVIYVISIISYLYQNATVTILTVSPRIKVHYFD